ncbi:hypothetical protein LSH36_775g00038 [Paralvinella palmiformis]|uniref:Peptidase S54 rhomboid domain-containing protein n=1 Tax=Paralvinella palmiformis TaxID=53620 RepID=A0AAD9J248_9ANNE|nr:hypothetical protein LSH36_775g00038 [Paralvinella palmiformis]
MTKRLQREKPRKKCTQQSAFTQLYKEFKHAIGKDEKRSVRKPLMRSRSYTPRTLCLYEAEVQKRGAVAEDIIEEEEFFDIAIGSSSYSRPLVVIPRLPKQPRVREEQKPAEGQTVSGLPPKHNKIRKQQVSPQYSKTPYASLGKDTSWKFSSRKRERLALDTTDSGEQSTKKPKAARSWDKDGDDIPDFLEKLWDNSERESVGLGCLERIFGGGKGSVNDEKRNKRPFFTYWVTLIQLIIFLVVIATYGIAPIGFATKQVEGEVLLRSLVTQLVTKEVKENLWIGPTQEDLIHLGAKYSPCMRVDNNVQDVIAIDNQAENSTACCVYNDGSGCVQVDEDDCPAVLSTWYRWNKADSKYNNPGNGSRSSGSVCGQDPRFCSDIEPLLPSNWPDDITTWPVCKNVPNITGDYKHMTCDIVGRPCCYGIQGECMITTREHCDFENGFFHEEATLCSQVKCIAEVCGMLPFMNKGEPDQFYRFLTSLFLHSGVLTIIITLILQLILMRDLEKMIGWLPMFFIYLGGGMVGGLASVIFIPYYVETGPSGSQMAVLGALFVEVMRWNTDEVKDKPGQAIGKIIAVAIFLFVVGLFLVDVNNWSNFFGLFYGVCVMLTFRPIKELRGVPASKACWVSTIVVCAVLSIGIIVILVVLFYVIPVTECDACLYFNCIPVTPTYCDGLTVSIHRNTSIAS